jgi:hypothetical protein
MLELACEENRHLLFIMRWSQTFPAAFKLNKAKEFENQPPVYAVLTDLRDFHFLRYDGSRFELYGREIAVSPFSRSAFLDGMRNGLFPHSLSTSQHVIDHPVVSEHLFSIILEGYISNLSAIQNRSSLRGAHSDVRAQPQLVLSTSDADFGVSEHNSASVGKPEITTPMVYHYWSVLINQAELYSGITAFIWELDFCSESCYVSTRSFGQGRFYIVRQLGEDRGQGFVVVTFQVSVDWSFPFCS